MVDLEAVKLRYGIYGSDAEVSRALEVALKVAPTDLSVVITGESGVGKEIFPQIIHANSPRKHGSYIAVNCGAIPEGTINSELFGHEKGAFTGASETRKGYFEISNGGTIFLDEVAELPLTTQVRLLRVLQSGEFMKVGSSKVQKTDVRVVAATNVNLPKAIESGAFREDLYYRLNTVPINVPPLRSRKSDIFLLFRKFSSEVALQYRMPMISLTNDARELIDNYQWPGNVRQLKNVAEQISVIEESRMIDSEIISKYLPIMSPATTFSSGAGGQRGGYGGQYGSSSDIGIDREMLYNVMREMRMDISDIKRMLVDMRGGAPMTSTPMPSVTDSRLMAWENAIATPISEHIGLPAHLPSHLASSISSHPPQGYVNSQVEDIEDINTPEVLTKQMAQKEAIIKSLIRHGGRRKEAANELFISERTLYRRIKELEIEEDDY